MLNIFQVSEDLKFFRKALDRLEEKVDALHADCVRRQTALGEQLAGVLEKLTESSLTVKQTEDRFACCANGFGQIKECSEALLDRLDEALGVVTARSWNEGIL